MHSRSENSPGMCAIAGVYFSSVRNGHWMKMNWRLCRIVRRISGWIRRRTSRISKRNILRKDISYAVLHRIIESREFIQKFDSMADAPEEWRTYYTVAREILIHRSGQNGEDLYLYDSKLKKWYKSVSGKKAEAPEYTEEQKRAIADSERDTLISFHNHPASMTPGVEDINSAFQKGYRKGYVRCHNGRIFEYTRASVFVSETIYERKIAKLIKKGYNVFDAQMNTIKELSKLYGFSFKEVQ